MIGLTDLVEAANRQVFLAEQVAALDEQLKAKKQELKTQSEEIVPSMMMELGMTKFTLANGYELSIKDEVYAKIPENTKFAAFQWLRDRNLDGIIKTQVSMDFGKGEDEEASRIVQTLADMGIYAKTESTIHPQTLKAFLREQISLGSGVPLEDFGATVVKTTVIRMPN